MLTLGKINYQLNTEITVALAFKEICSLNDRLIMTYNPLRLIFIVKYLLEKDKIPLFIGKSIDEALIIFNKEIKEKKLTVK